MKKLECISLKCIIAIFVLILFPACGLIFGTSGKVDQKNSEYRVKRLDRDNRDWKRIETGEKEKDESYSAYEQNPDQADIAFEHKPTGAIASLNSVCKPQKNLTLEMLTKNLLMGLPESITIHSRETDVDGAKALDTLVETNNAMRVRTIVLKKLGCTFDLMYIVKNAHYEKLLSDFDGFVKGFHVE